jgi:hypothetical protein
LRPELRWRPNAKTIAQPPQTISTPEIDPRPHCPQTDRCPAYS